MQHQPGHGSLAIIFLSITLSCTPDVHGDADAGGDDPPSQADGQAPGRDADQPDGNFERRQQRDDCVASYALRDPAEIDRYDHGFYFPSTATYDPEADAARITLPAGDQNSAQQIRLPVPDTATGVGHRLAVVWEWKASENWTYENGLRFHKMFQVASNDAIWYEIGNGYRPAPDGGSRTSRIRAYATLGPDTFHGPFTVDGSEYGGDSVGPILANAFVPPETWIRFAVEFDRRTDGFVYIRYLVSIPGQEPILVHDNLALTLGPTRRITSFWYETNSSALRAAPGPEIWCYGRNVTMHLDVDDLRNLL